MNRAGGEPGEVQNGEPNDERARIFGGSTCNEQRDRPECTHDDPLDEDTLVGFGQRKIEKKFSHDVTNTTRGRSDSLRFRQLATVGSLNHEP